MKAFRFLARAMVLLVALLNLHAQATNTNSTVVIGQWDFNSASLTAATVGAPLQLVGGIQPTFVTSAINGRPAGVMRFPAATETQGFLATQSAGANGGGTNLNIYTLLMDVMWPSESDGAWRALFNTDTNNLDDAEIFVNPDNAVGIFNDYAFVLQPNTWYRLALVYNLTNNSVTRYLDGNTNGAPQILQEGGLDSRFSLPPAFLLFADNDLETAPGFVNSIQLRSGALSVEEIQALGGPSSGGLGEGADPVGDIRIEGIQRAGNNIVITVSGGRAVQLQKKVRLNDPAWQDLGLPSSSGTFTVPLAEATSFFRVRLQ